MNKNNTRIQFHRTPSVILLSDEDDEVDKNTPSRYSTPMESENQHPMVILPQTTNQMQLTSSLLSSQRSFSRKAKEQQQEIIETNVSVSPMVSPIGLSQPNYLSYTINMNNQERLSILPTYPNMNKDTQSVLLLLANVPINHLSQQELRSRRTGKYKALFSITDCDASPISFIVQQYQTFYVPLLDRLHVDLSILDCNYIHLKEFIELHRQAYIRTLGHQSSLKYQFNLHENEFAPLLEFYLQIDVDLFYMKTCSFRGAQPRLKEEGLFCSIVPECHYAMERCKKCVFCESSAENANYRQEQQQQQPCPIQFNMHRKHRFVNGFESILNCPTSCDTNNIIYVLTCQCGNYDYIGETSVNLRTRYQSHKCFTHRLILEKLIGEKNYLHFYGAKSPQMIEKERIRLYQHPIGCSSAIQAFLNHNPDYWIFVPVLNEEANHENIHYQKSSLLATTTTKEIQACVGILPKPPLRYKFSNYQIKKQYEFFAKKLYTKQVNYNFIVYKATIVAVLPLNTSQLFRQLIHSLFVTHAETKLNTLGHIFTYFRNVPINQNIWCANLHYRPAPLPTITSANMSVEKH